MVECRKNFFVTHVFAFLKFGFFMSGTMSDNFSAAYDYVLLCICLHIIHTYIYKFETSFSDISGSNNSCPFHRPTKNLSRRKTLLLALERFGYPGTNFYL